MPVRPAPEAARILLGSITDPADVEGSDSDVRLPSGAMVARAVVIGRKGSERSSSPVPHRARPHHAAGLPR